jgi:F-type H+-transporting ATPase subunit b
MLELLEDPRAWTAIAFVVFVILAYKKVSTLLTNALDARTAKIKAELEEASRLRQEAEAILAQYTQKQSQYMLDVESILTDARRDAEALTQHAHHELTVTLDTRMKNALQRIAQEESKAIADVRNHVVAIALAAAREVIADHKSAVSEDELLQLALGDIERKIH